ncbi:AAA family ATPase [Legionella quateirensis]|uniref:AAA domain (Dynein-related subfamily) n=1 Tax=Legionella quateirensis TaxID=45072 RepID=A0A378KS43_9GAMM|nr:AAA family ATPase [Legionella quateirensis]KTD52849.1 AAA domain (dynein-related subfamily) [Legionella quateirensis]STY16421.1 DnaA regulatory inactivator Hda [Legionella quateirensis]
MKKNIDILKAIGLLYEKTALPVIESSSEPNGGVLNIERVLNDNPECWDTVISGTSQLEQKTIFINCDFNEDLKDDYLKKRIISKLIEEGFALYFRTSKGLMKLEDPLHVEIDLPSMVPITPQQQSAEIKNLNLTKDRIELLDKSRLNELSELILSAPDLFFHFINFSELNDFSGLISDINCTECIYSNLKGGVEWSYDTPSHFDSGHDWSDKHELFERKILSENKSINLWPPFLPSAQTSETDDSTKRDLYLDFLLKWHSDLLKKIRYASIPNTECNLISLLNQTESLISLSMNHCEFRPIGEEQLYNSTLRHLEIKDTPVPADVLSEVLLHAPNLASLAISGFEINEDTELNFQHRTLSKLQNLILENKLRLSVQQLNALLNATPNLNKLKLDSINLNYDSSLHINSPLIHLNELDIKFTVGLSELYYFLSNTPNLEVFTLSGINNADSDLTLFQTTNEYKNLRKLNISDSTFSPEQLSALLKITPGLCEFELKSSLLFDDQSFDLKKNSLSQLIHFNASGTYITTSQLKCIFEAAPNMQFLGLNPVDDFLEFLSSLNANLLPSLTTIQFEWDCLSVAELGQLVKIAPNLKMIRMIQPDKDGEAALNWFIQSYPHIKIIYLEPPPPTESYSEHSHFKSSSKSLNGLIADKHIKSSSKSLDGLIADKHSNPILPARRLFKAKEETQPHFSNYHLNSFTWDSGTRTFVPELPLEINLEPIDESLQLTNQQVEDLFNRSEPTSNYIYGQISLSQPVLNQWIQVPGLSLDDELVHFANSTADFELKKDKYSGYYFIKFNKPTLTSVFNYIIKSSKPLDDTLNHEAPEEHLDWLSKCTFDLNGRLADSPEYQKLRALDYDQRVQALASFCRFPETSAAHNINGDAIDVLNGLIHQRSGVCRHRAQLFVAMAESLGISAALICNDVHVFVKVRDGNRRYSLDLGGGAAHLIDLPMPALSNSADKQSHLTQAEQVLKQEKAAKKTVKKQFIPLTEDNRFQTWNNVPIVANDAAELAEKLIAKDACARQWLIFKDKQGLEILHQQSTQYQNCFFSRDLDALKLEAVRIDKSKDTKVDSPLSLFIKTAADHPNETYTWFINWSDPKARHVGLNSVIDNEGRNLDGLVIPSNVHIVVGTDQTSASKMGDDFYSRFDAISQAPEIPAMKLPEIKANQPINEGDILFPSPLTWETVLLGRPSLDNGILDMIPGALMKASVTKTDQLTLHNAPFEDPKFRFFINELMRNKRFFFNGEWHHLSEHFHLNFVTPDLSTYPIIIEPGEHLNFTRVVNQHTYPLLFNQYKIGDDQRLKSQVGFLESDSSIQLIITEHLTEIQWYTLLKEAKENNCALSIQTTPDVFIPAPLRSLVTVGPSLKNNDTLFIATDLDAVQDAKVDEHALIINVDLKTNFNQLFYHVSLNNREFNGQETELLKAIRTGKKVVLKGRFSVTLAQQLQTLFIDPPTIRVNGESISASNLTLISDDATPFKAIHPNEYVYQPEMDFNRLSKALDEQLKKTYQRLRLTPCHSHFADLPEDMVLHEAWVDNLIKRLEWSAGALPDSTGPTSPVTVMNYLEHHSFVFLTSKTGEGKSHFVQKTLREYCRKQNKPITLYYEMTGIKDWLRHSGESQSVLFIDEANLANEHYAVFEALARGDKNFWFEGECYPLTNHKVIFAGNPTQYEGRFEPDLFKHYPNYLPFKGQSLETILTPLLEQYANANTMLELIEAYYGKAQDAGLTITPRNAQMMCLRFFILKESLQTQLLPDDFLLRYAILSEIKTLSLDKKLSRDIRNDIKLTTSWREDKNKLKDAVQHAVPQSSDQQFVWTESRNKAAYAIETLLLVRDKKVNGQFKQEHGINGLILEGEPGMGKSKLVSSLLKAKGIDFVTISPTTPDRMQNKLLEAFHQGQVVVIDEFNTLVNEQLLNALLSGYDLEGNPPQNPGFCIIGTQNPTTFHGRQMLSKALDNRLMHIELRHYKFNEINEILTKKFNLTPDDAVKLTEEYLSARNFAREQGLFPPPNPRNIINKAEDMPIQTDISHSTKVK